MNIIIGFDTIGERLQLQLHKVGLTQKQIEEKLGIPQSTISNCIQGGIPETETLYKLSNFFEVSMEWLLIGEEKAKCIRDEENQLIQTFRTLNEKQREKSSRYLVGITNTIDGLNNRLKLQMKNAGYKHGEVTSGANLAKNILSKYLKGRIPDPKALYKLSKFFEVSMEWFLEGEVIIEGLSTEENQFIQNYRMLQLKEQGKIIGCMDGMILDGES